MAPVSQQRSPIASCLPVGTGAFPKGDTARHCTDLSCNLGLARPRFIFRSPGEARRKATCDFSAVPTAFFLWPAARKWVARHLPPPPLSSHKAAKAPVAADTHVPTPCWPFSRESTPCFLLFLAQGDQNPKPPEYRVSEMVTTVGASLSPRVKPRH